MTEINAPLNCPDCNETIEEFTEPRSNITTHWCVNDLCPGRLKAMLVFIASRHVLEIDGLGPELAALLVSKGYVCSLPDLFEFHAEAQGGLDSLGSPEFSKVMVLKYGLPASAVITMIRSIEKVKTAGWDRWIAALGIPMIGVTLGKVLAEKLDLKSDGLLNLPESLLNLETMQIDGFGVHKKAEVLKAARDVRFMANCARLHEVGIRPRALTLTVVQGTPLKDMSFVITGEFPNIGTREYITSKLVSLGAVSKSGVTKKVTHLLVGEEAGQSKLGKAAALNIPHLDAAWLEETFEKYGFSVVGSRFFAEEVG